MVRYLVFVSTSYEGVDVGLGFGWVTSKCQLFDLARAKLSNTVMSIPPLQLLKLFALHRLVCINGLLTKFEFMTCQRGSKFLRSL